MADELVRPKDTCVIFSWDLDLYSVPWSTSDISLGVYWFSILSSSPNWIYLLLPQVYKWSSPLSSVIMAAECANPKDTCLILFLELFFH